MVYSSLIVLVQDLAAIPVCWAYSVNVFHTRGNLTAQKTMSAKLEKLTQNDYQLSIMHFKIECLILFSRLCLYCKDWDNKVVLN